MTYNVFGGTLNLALSILSIYLSIYLSRLSWLLVRFQVHIESLHIIIIIDNTHSRNEYLHQVSLNLSIKYRDIASRGMISVN